MTALFWLAVGIGVFWWFFADEIGRVLRRGKAE